MIATIAILQAFNLVMVLRGSLLGLKRKAHLKKLKAQRDSISKIVDESAIGDTVKDKHVPELPSADNFLRDDVQLDDVQLESVGDGSGLGGPGDQTLSGKALRMKRLRTASQKPNSCLSGQDDGIAAELEELPEGSAIRGESQARDGTPRDGEAGEGKPGRPGRRRREVLGEEHPGLIALRQKAQRQADRDRATIAELKR